MSDLKWQRKTPQVVGWYWLKYPNGNVSMWFFDGSDWDIKEVARAEWSCGPLPQPEEYEDG
jgi:hypothetical protein